MGWVPEDLETGLKGRWTAGSPPRCFSESTVSLDTLMLEANRDAQAGAVHDQGEMCPWVCTVASVMSDVWGPAQDSNEQPTGQASKAHLSLISPSHHSPSLYSFSPTFPTLSSLAALPLHNCCRAPLLVLSSIASLPLHVSILPTLLPTLPSPLAACPNSMSEVIFLRCKSQQKQVNNLKQSGPFLSSYTCLPLN